MKISILTESSNVQSLPTLGVSLTIRGGEAWTRATLATKGMVHFIFEGGWGGISLSSTRSGQEGGGGWLSSSMVWWYVCSGLREREIRSDR